MLPRGAWNGKEVRSSSAGLVAPTWHQLLSPTPLSCLGHQKEADGEDADGGTVAAAPIHSEAVLRPVAGVAMTWLTSVWHIWEGQPIRGQDIFSGLSRLQITWYVCGKPVQEKKNRKAVIDLLWRAGDGLLN